MSIECAPLTEPVIIKNEPCRFCKSFDGTINVIDHWGKKIVQHMIITKAEDGSLHLHGPQEDEKMMNEFIDFAMQVVHQNSKNKTEQK